MSYFPYPLILKSLSKKDSKFRYEVYEKLFTYVAIDETMSFNDNNVQFRFVPTAEYIRMSIKSMTDYKINLVRDNAEYIDYLGESRRIHYGYDYVQEVRNFEGYDLYVLPIMIDPDSEISGYVWVDFWPDFCIGQDRHFITTAQINYLMEPFIPRYSFEGRVEDLKDSTFNLVLPIDFGGYTRNYTFTFMINDVIE